MPLVFIQTNWTPAEREHKGSHVSFEFQSVIILTTGFVKMLVSSFFSFFFTSKGSLGLISFMTEGYVGVDAGIFDVLWLILFCQILISSLQSSPGSKINCDINIAII